MGEAKQSALKIYSLVDSRCAFTNQVAPTSNAKEAKVEWFYEDLQDLLELTPKKDDFFIIGD